MVAVLNSEVLNNNKWSNSSRERAASDGANIAICAKDKGDAERVAFLIGPNVSEGTSLYFHDYSHLPGGEYFAAIVCHRRTEKDRHVKMPPSLGVFRLIVLTDSNNETEIVSHLNTGARHVFNMDESDKVLEVRLEAALRQHRKQAMQNLRVGNFNFDVARRQVQLAGKHIDLSPKEYEFAHYLFSREGTVVSNTELMTSVWSLPSFMDTRRIDTAACRVRKKLSLVVSHGWQLKKIRCVGYRLSRLPVDATS